MISLSLDPSNVHLFLRAIGILKRLQNSSGTYFTSLMTIQVRIPSFLTAVPYLSPTYIFCNLCPFPKMIDDLIGLMFLKPSFECVMWLDTPVSPIHTFWIIPTSLWVDPKAIVFLTFLQDNTRKILIRFSLVHFKIDQSISFFFKICFLISIYRLVYIFFVSVFVVLLWLTMFFPTLCLFMAKLAAEIALPIEPFVSIMILVFWV